MQIELVCKVNPFQRLLDDGQYDLCIYSEPVFGLFRSEEVI
jgi:hypothetical protein